MRRVQFTIVLACLCWLIPRAWAGDPPVAPAKDTLLEAVAQSPITLAEAVRSSSRGSGRMPLSAGFALDTADQLLARVLLSVREKEKRSFEEWIGPVQSGGWVPRRRVLEEEAEIAEGARLLALLEPVPEAIWQALVEAVCPERVDRPADVVLSAAPASHAGTSAVDLLVGVGDDVRGLAFAPQTSKFTPERVAAPKRVPHEARTLPPLEVPAGRWFTAEKAPTLTAWRGQPVLVLVTSPG